jgi:hypothetical protein
MDTEGNGKSRIVLAGWWVLLPALWSALCFGAGVLAVARPIFGLDSGFSVLLVGFVLGVAHRIVWDWCRRPRTRFLDARGWLSVACYLIIMLAFPLFAVWLL